MARKPANLTISDDLYGTWRHRIERAEDRVKEMRQASKEYRDAWKEEFASSMPTHNKSEQVTVSRVHRTVEQWKGAIRAQNPKIILEPPWSTKKVNRKTIALNEAIMNTEIARAGTDETADKALQTALIDAWGWEKSGFHAEVEEDSEAYEELSTDAAAEEQGFELGQQYWPTEVLLSEPHEEHNDAHKRFLDEKTAQLQETVKGFQETSQAAMQAGLEMGVPPDQVQAMIQQNSMVIQQEIQRLQQMVEGIQAHMELHEGQIKARDRKGLNPTDHSIRAENCWTSYIHNSNVVWDLLATGPHDWRWIAERFIKPLPEVKKMFPNAEGLTADYAGPRPGSTGTDKDGEQNQKGSGGGVRSAYLENEWLGGEADPDALCSYWKVWDIEHRRVIYIHPAKNDGPLQVKKWPHKFLKSAPIRMLYFELEEDSFRPIPPVKHFWAQQLELNRYRTKSSIVTRRNSQVAIAHPSIPDEFIEEVKNAEECSIAKLTTPGVKPNDAFKTMEWGQVPVDVWNMAQVTEHDIEAATGMSEAVMGGTSKAKTATAAEMQKMGSSIPLDLKLGSLEKFIINIADDLRNLMRQYYKAERWQELFWEGSKVVEMWRGDDLLDFEIAVEVGSSRRRDKDVETMQWSQATELAMQIPEADTLFAYRRYLESLGVRNTDDALISQGEQQVQQAMEGPGPGQGQGQQELPGKVAGPQGAAPMPAAADLTK